MKAYGTLMMANHMKSHAALKEIATSNSIALDDKLDAEHQAVADKLKMASAADFDKVFMEEMVVRHRKAIAANEMASKQSKDARVKALADNSLPALRSTSWKPSASRRW